MKKSRGINIIKELIARQSYVVNVKVNFILMTPILLVGRN